MSRIFHLVVSAIIIVACILALEGISKGQGKFRSLRLVITTKSNSICYGDRFFIMMQVKNVGKKEILINSSSLWSVITFETTENSSFGLKAAKVYQMYQSTLSHPDDKWIMLRPGQVYKNTKEIVLDAPFFKEAGEFRFDVSYQHVTRNGVELPILLGTITSNKKKLRVALCRSNESETHQRGKLLEVGPYT